MVATGPGRRRRGLRRSRCRRLRAGMARADTRTRMPMTEATTMTDLPTSVDIREVGPRDGLQIETPISTDDKIRLITALVATGVRRIEATAFVSPRAVPAMADAEQIAQYVLSVPGVQWSGLVASPNGAKRAIGSGLRSIEYGVSAADGPRQANAR